MLDGGWTDFLSDTGTRQALPRWEDQDCHRDIMLTPGGPPTISEYAQVCGRLLD